MADTEFWNYARARADIVQQHSPQEKNYQDHYLECELSRGNCLIPLDAIVEVMPSPQKYTQLPLIPIWMPGLVAWRGEAIALIDLDMYLCGLSIPRSDGMLLLTTYDNITLGLLVPAVGLTTTIQFELIHSARVPTVFYTPMRAGVIKGVYAEKPVLDVAALLPDVIQQIGIAAYHG